MAAICSMKHLILLTRHLPLPLQHYSIRPVKPSVFRPVKPPVFPRETPMFEMPEYEVKIAIIGFLMFSHSYQLEFDEQKYDRILALWAGLKV